MTPRELARHTFVVVVWFAAFRLTADYAVRLLPLSIARQLTLQNYLTLVAIVVSALGLALSFLLLPDAKRALGLSRAQPLRIGALVVLAPAIYVVSSYLAIWIALPTLLAEIAQGGREAAQKSTGEFGRELVQASALSALFWGVVVSPIAEELLFRGAFWSLIQRAIDFLKTRLAAAPSPSAEEPLPSGVITDSAGLRASRAIARFFVTGGIATLVSAAIFALMHADMPGGLGIVRWVSAAGLGVATGLARQLTQSLLGPIVVHVAYNLLSLATTRRWVVTESFPMKLGVPTLLSLTAAIGVVLLAVVLGARKLGRRTT